MTEKTRSLVLQAEECLRNRQSAQAAKCFEDAAAAERSKAGTALLLKRAAEAYADDRATSDAGRCYRKAGHLLDKEGKAECLMAYWRLLILEIAGYLYDCGYEWRGDSEAHHADHVFYEQRVQEIQEEAARILAEALSIEGIDRRALLEQARQQCREREKDGWGASICWAIVAGAEESGQP